MPLRAEDDLRAAALVYRAVADQPDIAGQQVFVLGDDLRQVRRASLFFAFEDELQIGARRQARGFEGVERGDQVHVGGHEPSKDHPLSLEIDVHRAIVASDARLPSGYLPTPVHRVNRASRHDPAIVSIWPAEEPDPADRVYGSTSSPVRYLGAVITSRPAASLGDLQAAGDLLSRAWLAGAPFVAATPGACFRSSSPRVPLVE